MSGRVAVNLMASALRNAVNADAIPAYDARAFHIADAIGYAGLAGIEWGIRIDPAEPEWPVVYFELPTGQVSYHMPQHVEEWDGHTTDEKNDRISEWWRQIHDAPVSRQEDEG